MSKPIASFDPSASLSGTIDPAVANPCGVAYLFNESSYGLQLTFADGTQKTLPPWYYRPYTIEQPGVIKWTQLYVLNTSGSPASLVFGESYESSEASTVNFSEGPLPRQTNVGNTVSTSMGAATQLVNSGQTSPTQIISASVVGDASQAVQMYNDGQLILGDNTYSGVLSVVGPSSQIYLNNNGSSTWFGVTESTGSTVAALYCDASNNLTIQAASSGTIILRDNAGVEIGYLDDNGFHISKGALNLVTGRITSQSAGSIVGAGITTPVTVTHGLPSTPRVMLTYDLGTSTTSSAACPYIGNRGPTTFQVYATNNITVLWQAFTF